MTMSGGLGVMFVLLGCRAKRIVAGAGRSGHRRWSCSLARRRVVWELQLGWSVEADVPIALMDGEVDAEGGEQLLDAWARGVWSVGVGAWSMAVKLEECECGGGVVAGRSGHSRYYLKD
jgi:hypothetical protein